MWHVPAPQLFSLLCLLFLSVMYIYDLIQQVRACIGPPPRAGLELVERVRMRHRRGQDHDGRDGDGQSGAARSGVRVCE